MEKQYTNDEIDLGLVFRKIREGYHSFLIGLYGLILRIIKLWYVVLFVLITAAVLGFLVEKYGAKEYESSLVVQIKQKSTAYIYDQIEFINKSLYDEEFLKKYNLQKNEVLRFDMEAIPDFSEVLDDYENQNTSVIEYLLDNASAEDILRSEFFRTSYRFHRIEIVFGDNYNTQTVTNFIAMINANNRYDKVSEFYKDYYPMKVRELKKMNAQIDSIVANYTKDPTSKDPITSIYLGEESENLPRLIEYKNYLLRFLEEASYDDVFGQEKVNLINEVPISKKKMILRPLFLYPLLGLILFILLIRLVDTVKKAQRLYLENKM